MQAITTAQNVGCDGVIMHPTNWLTILLLKDADGNYMNGGGPLAALPRPMLWGKPVALTTAITLGTALVGELQAYRPVFPKRRHSRRHVELALGLLHAKSRSHPR